MIDELMSEFLLFLQQQVSWQNWFYFDEGGRDVFFSMAVFLPFKFSGRKEKTLL